MNKVCLVGRLTDDPKCKYTPTGTAILNVSLAIDRPTKKDEAKKTDFPRLTIYGKTAEAVEMYSKKGLRLAVEGRLETSSYKNKAGEMVYSYSVSADRVDILDFKPRETETATETEPTPPDYSHIEGDIPF